MTDETRSRNVRLTLFGAVVAMTLPAAAMAYERYNDGCQNCHGAFTSGTSPAGTVFPSDDKHKMHRDSGYMNTDCNLCHTSGDGRNPFLGSSDGTPNNTGYGCAGCHGRDYGGMIGVSGVGLRAHHAASDVTVCGFCHGSDPAPLGEDVAPPYYGTVDTNVDDPCNASPNYMENWSIGDVLGLDNDGDGLYDTDDPDCAVGCPNSCGDECPNDPNKTRAGICGCGTPDTDTDGDGALDCRDDCPNDAGKVAPGICGCGTPDTDTDGDGSLDCRDSCPNDAGKVAPGVCGCGTPDEDLDADGVKDCVDNCALPNPDQADGDGDDVGDPCEEEEGQPADPLLAACGGGVGTANLAAFWTLCWIGLMSLRGNHFPPPDARQRSRPIEHTPIAGLAGTPSVQRDIIEPG